MNRKTGMKPCPGCHYENSPYCFNCNPSYNPVLRCQECFGPSKGGRMSLITLKRNGMIPSMVPDFIPCCQLCFSKLQHRNKNLGYILTFERIERFKL